MKNQAKSILMDRWMMGRRQMLRKELPSATFLQICIIAAEQWAEQERLSLQAQN